MTMSFLRRAGLAFLLFVAVVVALLMLPGARLSANSSGTLEACINPGNGMMRLVDPSTACHNNETRVEWDITGPAGPPGSPGPPGPPGASGGGPPFVWVCTPLSFPNAGGGPRGDLYVFNGGTTTANVAVNILDKDGNNLAGVSIPGASPPENYPGQSGSTTVPLGAGGTSDLNWTIPTTGGPGFDGVTNVSFSARVTSDQPIVVGIDLGFSGFHPGPCSLLPK
jgi:hypothetical protein